jgi:hypothetical protein
MHLRTQVVAALVLIVSLASAALAGQGFKPCWDTGKQTVCTDKPKLTLRQRLLHYAQDTECPAGYPLDCSNGHCCPAGSTLYCPQMEPTPCFNPDQMTEEQLAILRDHCDPLLSCH